MSKRFMFDDVNLGGAYNLGDLGELGINTDLFNFNLDLPQLNQGNMLSTVDLINDPELFKAFSTLYPEDAALLENIKLPSEGGKEYVSQNPSGLTEPPSTTGAEGAGFPGEGIKSGVKEWDDAAKKAGVELTDPNASTGIKKILEDLKKGFKDITGLDAGDAAKYAAMIAAAKMAKDDAEAARKEARGAAFKSKAPVTATRQAYKGTKYATQGGLMSLAQGGKTSLPPRYFNGHSDGMADKVPAQIDNRRPAALSDGEFVIPADVVSHLGNGNSSAGAKRLYEMMDRIRHARTGNPKQGKQINPDKFLPR